MTKDSSATAGTKNNFSDTEEETKHQLKKEQHQVNSYNWVVDTYKKLTGEYLNLIDDYQLYIKNLTSTGTNTSKTPEIQWQQM
ncbi:hypothetical protein [Effusibacillus dendaii]|uniref:Uncharacterized protein n=1 Tax=Effusibacillus dendaii TaxID=2743772 RepID=A0A7I8D732_9BACL|nr:hypothetical protein [Effusibacillus dendaii]BCJ85797.1 hypothetical protein skT53_07820 [Effusibacillus dendaii]